MSELTGYLYDNTGTAIESATVQLLTKNTSTQIASTTTSAAGKWAFSSAAAAVYDVKITYGSSIRYIKADQEVQATMGEFITSESNSTFPLRAENATNNASNAVLELRGNNSTRADGDEIYVSFKLDDDGGNVHEFARITGEAVDVSNGSEDGQIRFGVSVGGTMTDVFKVNSSTTGVTSVTYGADDTGYDVKFHGASAGAFMVYDESEDTLEIRGPSADATTSTGKILLSTALTDINANDVLGKIDFKAPLEAGGTDAIAVAASIQAVAQATFSASVNETDMLFMTGKSEAATEKFRITADGEFGVGGANYGSSGQVLTSGGAGSAPSWATPTTGDITGVTAGVGLSGGGSSGGVTLTLDLSELSAVTPASGDGLATVDSDGANEQLTTVDALATLHAGDGLSASSAVMAVDLGTNSGLEISSNKLQIAKGISQHDTAQFTSGVADNDFLRVDGAVVEGRSASEVLSDIGAGAAAGSSSIVTTGALDSGSITSGFGNIDNGSSTLDTGALDASTGTFSGVLKTDDTTNATSTTDGSLQTDGGLSVALDAIFGDDVTLITDAAVLNLGVGSDVSLTHDNATGGTLSGTPMTIDSLGASALANDTYTGIVLGFISNGTIAIGNAVYIHTADGRVAKAQGDAVGTMPCIGVAVTGASDGGAIKILTHGIYNDSDGFGGDLTEGNIMYVDDDTAGLVTATIPDADGEFVQRVGIAVGPRDVFVNPSLDVIERD